MSNSVGTFYITNGARAAYFQDEPEKLNENWGLRRETRTLLHECHSKAVYYEFLSARLQCPGCHDELPRYLHMVVKAAWNAR